MDRMLSPIVTTILSYIVVIIVSYVSYRISNYYIRKGKGSAWVLVNATFSSTLCFSILSTYVNDIYALVYQGDYEVIKKTMSIMLLLTLLHTFIVFPFLALLDYDKSGDVIFTSFKNRYSLLFSIEFFMVFLMLLGVITDLLLGHSADPVYVLLRQSASDKFPYVTYLLGFGFLIGIPTFLVYFSVGMVAIPIADILNYRRARKNKEASVFDYSGPVVEYVAEEESAESEPEQYISTLNEAGVNGNSIALLQQSRSRSVPKQTKQTVVIKSHYNEGWVSMVFESHPKVHILSCFAGPLNPTPRSQLRHTLLRAVHLLLPDFRLPSQTYRRRMELRLPGSALRNRRYLAGHDFVRVGRVPPGRHLLRHPCHLRRLDLHARADRGGRSVVPW
ncbi:hypothetical protein WA577_007366, partial [Blastocystis sp. JDR]